MCTALVILQLQAYQPPSQAATQSVVRTGNIGKVNMFYVKDMFVLSLTRLHSHEQYRIGQQVQGLNHGAITGVIISIAPENPGHTDGPGLITVQQQAQIPQTTANPPQGAQGVVKPAQTSNVGKYQIGQRVDGLAGGTISGVIVRLQPNVDGATSG
jgi:hypothetical protein